MANFSSFKGADIVATFNGKVIGELQSITYSTERRDEPYAIGGSGPREPVEIRSAGDFKKFFGDPKEYSGTLKLKDVEINRDVLYKLLYGQEGIETVWLKEPENNKEAARRLHKGDL
jgi:hypothetical protein